MFSQRSKQKIKGFGEQFSHDKDPAFDSSVFNDPIAEQTRWGALALGGSSSRAVRQVISADRQQIKYRPTLGSLVLVGLFTVVCPLMWLLLKSPVMGSGKHLSDGFTVVLGVFSVVFLVAGIAWLRSLLAARYIDLSQRRVVCGRSKWPLASVHAIQIVPEKVKVSRSTGDPGSKPRYYVSYELNLVFGDASRCNLMDHADYADISRSAEELSRLLAVPVWDRVAKDERF